MNNLFLQSLSNGLFNGILFGGIAVSLAVAHLSSRALHVAIGAVIALTAYQWLALVGRGSPTLFGVLAIVVSAFGANWVFLAAYRWLFRRGVDEDGVIVGSFGLLTAGTAALELAYGSEAYSLRAPWMLGSISLDGLRISNIDLIVSTCILLLLFALWFTTRLGSFGLQLRSIFHDIREAEIAGVNATLVQVVAYAFCGALVVVIALAIGSRASVTPQMGFFPLLIGIAAIVVGGMGSILAAFVGGFILGVIWDIVGIYWGTIWQIGAVFGILGMMLLVLPEGLLPLLQRRASKRTVDNLGAQSS